MVYFNERHVHFTPTTSDFIESSFNESPFNDNAIALVTGGSGGLGRELIKELVQHGVKVIVVDVKAPSLELCRANEVVFYPCDITDRDQVKCIYKKVKSEHGSVTILFNNAGLTNICLLEHSSKEDIQKVIDVNYIGAYIMIQTFLPDMIENNKGYIVNVASILGVITPARLSSYGASKAGLIALHTSMTRCLKMNYRGHSIKSLLVCPGKIKTPMFQNVETPSRILAPDIAPSKLAKKIIASMQHDLTNTFRSPFYANIIPFLKQLSWPYLSIFKKMSAMDSVTAI